MASPTSRLYFAYGSNLSPTQMVLRCPSSVPVGLAHLPDYTFIINARRYANVVRNPLTVAGSRNRTTASAFASASENAPIPSVDSTNPGVYGVLYTLPPADEAVLDRCEGAPYAYQKEDLLVTLVSATSPDPSSSASAPTSVHPSDAGIRLPNGAEVTALVYIDNEETEPATPWDEYVDRMNRGVDEATKLFGLPEGYVDLAIRPYIPASEVPIVDPTAIDDPFFERA